jgi:hypothetical protein
MVSAALFKTRSFPIQRQQPRHANIRAGDDHAICWQTRRRSSGGEAFAHDAQSISIASKFGAPIDGNALANASPLRRSLHIQCQQPRQNIIIAEIDRPTVCREDRAMFKAVSVGMGGIIASTPIKGGMQRRPMAH